MSSGMSDAEKRQAQCIFKILTGEFGAEFEGYLRVMACVEDPIETYPTDLVNDKNQVTHSRTVIDQVALNVRAGKQALYAEIIQWRRRAEGMNRDSDSRAAGGGGAGIGNGDGNPFRNKRGG